MIIIQDQKTFIRNLYSVILAILPAIAALRVPIVNKGLATVLLILTLPFPFWHFFSEHRLKGFLPLACALGWLMIRSLNSLSNLVGLMIVLIHCLGVLNGSVNKSLYRKTVETLGVFFAAVLLFQYVLYYIFGVPTYLLPDWILLEDNVYYVEKFFTSLRTEGLFRPCAFFLEPSHYTQYCIVGLVSAFFPEAGKVNWTKVIAISIGCILTTSGMGIAMVIGAYGWYFLFSKREKYTRLPILVILAFVGIVGLAFLLQIPFFRDAVVRVVSHDENGYNAISGRTLYWDTYITPLKGLPLLIGRGFQSAYDGYVTSLIDLIYAFGLVGAVLFYGTALLLGFRSRSAGIFFLCCAFGALMCFSNQTNFISVTFWMSLFLLGGAKKTQSQSASLEERLSECT